MLLHKEVVIFLLQPLSKISRRIWISSSHASFEDYQCSFLILHLSRPLPPLCLNATYTYFIFTAYNDHLSISGYWNILIFSSSVVGMFVSISTISQITLTYLLYQAEVYCHILPGDYLRWQWHHLQELLESRPMFC